jgi:hypothetical protein
MAMCLRTFFKVSTVSARMQYLYRGDQEYVLHLTHICQNFRKVIYCVTQRHGHYKK